MATVIDHGFDTISVGTLGAMPAAAIDELAFGVIGFDADTVVGVYNATESRMAGIARDRVMGQHFFEAIAQCMNNYLVAQRFVDEPELDATLPFVLTLRMRPTPVRLRLLASGGSATRYVLVER